MICLFLGAVLCGGTAAAQHTLGVTGGYGYGNARFYPDQETRAVWGCYTAGVTWRYYGPQRFVGGFGIDFEYLQRGFSFLQNPTEEDPAKYQWYTRRVKSLMLPIVWQPHIYLFKNRMRVYLDAAVFFSYNISSTFINEQGSTVSPEQSKGPWRGEYDFKVVRDNRWGYGLAGGGGVAVLVKQLEHRLPDPTLRTELPRALLLRLFGPAAQSQQVCGKYDGRLRKSILYYPPAIPAR